jgi:hypothetical protein
MGNMTVFGFIGFERWGHLRPSYCWVDGRRCFIPLAFGLWVRWPFNDRIGG